MVLSISQIILVLKWSSNSAHTLNETKETSRSVFGMVIRYGHCSSYIRPGRAENKRCLSALLKGVSGPTGCMEQLGSPQRCKGHQKLSWPVVALMKEVSFLLTSPPPTPWLLHLAKYLSLCSLVGNMVSSGCTSGGVGEALA